MKNLQPNKVIKLLTKREKTFVTNYLYNSERVLKIEPSNSEQNRVP